MNFLDQVSNGSRLLSGRALEGCRKTVCTTEHFANLVGGHSGCAEPLEQLRRVGERVAEDPDHGIFELPGGEPASLARDPSPASVIRAAET